jgi:hypothetical protein
MPLPGRAGSWSASQASRCAADGCSTDGQVQRRAVQLAAEHEGAGAHLLGDVVDDPGVRRGGGGQHRGAGRQLVEQRADAPVVGAEVVPPVGDAVRLVDHQQPGRRRQLRQHGVTEAGVVQPLGADQQDVDLAALDGVVDLLPLLDVRAVHGDRDGAGPLGSRDLVAHEGQQRADDDGRPCPAGTQQGGGHEVDRRLAPPGALHHQGPAPVGHQRLDRGPLVVAQHRRLAGQRAQVRLSLLTGRGRRRRRHGTRPCQRALT